MIYVEIEKKAKQDLDNLDPTVARRVLDKLEMLKNHPEPWRLLKKIQNNWYRVHAGTDWVAVGVLEGQKFTVKMVSHRSEIYKRLKRTTA